MQSLMESIDCLRTAERDGVSADGQLRALATTLARSSSLPSIDRRLASIGSAVQDSQLAARASRKQDGGGEGKEGEEEKDVTLGENHQRFRRPPPECNSEVATFLKRNGFMVDKKRGARRDDPDGGAPEPTAYLLDGCLGGVACVPDEYYDRYLTALGDDVLLDIPNYVSERRSPVFRMHLDLDLVLPAAATKRAVISLVRCIQCATALFYVTPPGDHCNDNGSSCNNNNNNNSNGGIDNKPHLAVIVMVSQIKGLKDNRGFKQGIHLIMPNLYVNWEMALDMRETYIMVLKRAFGDDARVWAAKHGIVKAPSQSLGSEAGGGAAAITIAPDGDTEVDRPLGGEALSWEKVIDHQIYTMNGLRMSFSHNMADCNACGGTRPKRSQNGAMIPTNCTGPCRGMGRYREARWYEPGLYLNGNGNEDDEKLYALATNVHHCIRQTSIRCTAEKVVTPGWALYSRAPKCDVSTLDPAWHNRQMRERNNPSARGYRGRGARGKNELDPADPRFARIVNLLHTIAAEPHRELTVTTVKCDARGNYYIVNVDGIGSRACLNLNPRKSDDVFCGEHNRARIYYQVSRAGLRQKCTCKCGEVYRYGTCQNFMSAIVRISAADEEVLFGDNPASSKKAMTVLARASLVSPSLSSSSLSLRSSPAGAPRPLPSQSRTAYGGPATAPEQQQPKDARPLPVLAWSPLRVREAQSSAQQDQGTAVKSQQALARIHSLAGPLSAGPIAHMGPSALMAHAKARLGTAGLVRKASTMLATDVKPVSPLSSPPLPVQEPPSKRVCI